MQFKYRALALSAVLALAAAPALAQQSYQNLQPSAESSAEALSSSQVLEMQQALQDGGYDVGPVDGIWGPQTAQALRDFQQAQGLESTGEPSQESLAALGVEDSSPTQVGGGAAGGEQPLSGHSGSTDSPPSPGLPPSTSQ